MSNYIQSTLAHFPDFFEDTISLIEKEFKYPSHHSFLTDFYPLMTPLNHQNCHILIDKDKVIGHIAVTERNLTYKGIKTKVALIGAIALNEKYQQQGNFTPFFNNIIEKYSKNNSLLLLWSDLKPLYNRFKFYEAGGVIQTGKKKLLSENLPNGWIKTNFKSLTPIEFAEIKSIYQNQDLLTLERSESDWDQIKEVTSCSLFINKKDNKISSYFIKDKGNDLSNIIHEFASIDNDIIPMSKDFTDYMLWLPEKYNSTFNKKDIFFGAFFKVADIKKLSLFLSKITNNQLSILEKKDSMIQVKYKSAEFDFSEEDFLTGIFGPNPISEFSEIMPAIYIAGLDSI